MWKQRITIYEAPTENLNGILDIAKVFFYLLYLNN